jgi:ferritin-like protein
LAEPAIDLATSFTALAIAAGLIQQAQTFDPFADDTSFMLGAYVFEDVGVTAYAGAAGLLTPASVKYAARILGTEGYHAGTIRGYLSEIGQGQATDAISAVRRQLSGVRDFGTDAQGNAYNISNVNRNGLSFARTAGQVLAIVYGGGTNSGLFFPNGVNGTIATATQPSAPETQASD